MSSDDEMMDLDAVVENPVSLEHCITNLVIDTIQLKKYAVKIQTFAKDLQRKLKGSEDSFNSLCRYNEELKEENKKLKEVDKEFNHKWNDMVKQLEQTNKDNDRLTDRYEEAQAKIIELKTLLKEDRENSNDDQDEVDDGSVGNG